MLASPSVPGPSPWVIPRVFWTLLLLTASLPFQCGGAAPLPPRAEGRHPALQDPQKSRRAAGPGGYHTEWDHFTCTRGVVLVSEGSQAEMTCSSSRDFLNVSVSLWDSQDVCRRAITQEGPGNVTKDGWHLQVQGGVAKLVILRAQTSQAGEYRWLLVGLQSDLKTTTLNVSRASDHDPDPMNHGKERGLMSPTVAALDALPSSLPGAAAAFLPVLLLTVGGLIAWYKCRGPPKHMQCEAPPGHLVCAE